MQMKIKKLLPFLFICVILEFAESQIDRITSAQYSSLAQSVEHAAVNRSVVGSSPTGGVLEYIRMDIRRYSRRFGIRAVEQGQNRCAGFD